MDSVTAIPIIHTLIIIVIIYENLMIDEVVIHITVAVTAATGPLVDGVRSLCHVEDPMAAMEGEAGKIIAAVRREYEHVCSPSGTSVGSLPVTAAMARPR